MPSKADGGRRPMPRVVGESHCRHSLREIGITSAAEWELWCSTNAPKLKRLNLPTRPEVAYDNPDFWPEYGGQYPPHWTDFSGTFRKSNPGGETGLTHWARYASRYRAASGYRGMKFSGIGEASVRGYSAAFGVFLAYSAFEAGLTALNRKTERFPLPNPQIAQRLRAALGDRFELGVDLLKKLPQRVSTFLGADADSVALDSQDIMLFAMAIRHLVAHGIFTPTPGGALTAKATRALWELSDAVLAHSATLFGTYVQSQGAGKAPTA